MPMLWKAPASLFGHRRAKFWGAFQQSLRCWTIHKNTTMVRAPLNPPGSPKVPAWKERHSGVVCMLSTGMKADGRLSHELIQAVKLKYGYKSDKLSDGSGRSTNRQSWMVIRLSSIARKGPEGSTSTPLMALTEGSVACPSPDARLFAVCRMLRGSPRAHCMSCFIPYYQLSLRFIISLPSKLTSRMQKSFYLSPRGWQEGQHPSKIYYLICPKKFHFYSDI